MTQPAAVRVVVAPNGDEYKLLPVGSSPPLAAGATTDKRVLKIDGAFTPRVLRFDTACGCEGCGIA